MQRAIGRLRARAGGVAGPPTASQAAWFRKGVGITSAANAVSQWADQSGNARHLVQATGAAQPTSQGDGTIIFNGTSHFLKVAYARNQPSTLYYRARLVTNSPAGQKYMIDGNTADKSSSVFNDLTLTPQSYAGTGYVGATAVTLNTYFSIAIVFNGASSSVQVSGVTTTGNMGAVNSDGLTVGANGSGLSWANCQFAEIIDYSAAHDAATQTSVLAYLNTL